MPEDTLELFVGILVIAVIVVLALLWARHSRNKTRRRYWKGTVTQKRVSTSTDEDGKVSHSYHVVVAQDGIPKPKKILVDSEAYDSFEVGNVIEKKLGELQPTKV